MRDSEVLSENQAAFSLERPVFSGTLFGEEVLLRSFREEPFPGGPSRTDLRTIALHSGGDSRQEPLRGDLRALLYCICPAQNVALSSRG